MELVRFSHRHGSVWRGVVLRICLPGPDAQRGLEYGSRLEFSEIIASCFVKLWIAFRVYLHETETPKNEIQILYRFSAVG